jgi:gas vesicle protein
VAKIKKSGGISPLGAALVGAAVGAAAVALSDKKTRERLKKKGHDLLEQGEKKLDEAKVKLDEAKVKGQDRLSKSLGDASNKVKTRRTVR